MRRIILLILVLFVTVPAMAASNVVVTATDDDVNCITLSFASDANLIRAFGLNIDVNNANIVKVTVEDENYRIYPGQIEFEGSSVSAYNTPYDPCDLGDGDLSIEMASLYTLDSNHSGDPDAGYDMQPELAGALLKLYVDNTPCSYEVAENADTGGVVMEDPCESAGVVIVLDDGEIDSGCDECMASTNPDYTNWEYWSKPDCWCYKYQCRGDADGTNLGPFWVTGDDLSFCRQCISKLEAQMAPGCECCDFDHQKLGPFWVSGDDLNILREYISKLEAQVPPCGNPPDDDFCFWLTP